MGEHQWLQTALAAYQPTEEPLMAYERVYRRLFLDLIEKNPRCLWRDDFSPGHITGSLLVANLDLSKVLLMHHPKLDLWLQFGGHCDGDGNVYRVALRELEEESGITPDMTVGNGGIFDLDIQCIPPRKDEPEHLHFDMRFLARFNEKTPIPGSSENLTMRWFTLDEAEGLVTPGHGRWRMVQKLRQMRDVTHGRA
ncbi:MAG: NUDIX hydrolase [Pseudomonadaceae bacterium]|nr:NUDIX hydrolase [Pseudomonadaceae bacterium]